MVLEMKKIKKTSIIIGVVLVILIAANVFWGVYNTKESPDSSDNISDEVTLPVEKEITPVEFCSETDFFAQYRLQREQSRSRELKVLQELVRSEEQSKTTRDTASMKIMSIMEDIQKEMKAENLVKSRGIEECVIISEAGMSTVVIKGSESAITEDEIKDLVCPVLKLNENQISTVFHNTEN